MPVCQLKRARARKPARRKGREREKKHKLAGSANPTEFVLIFILAGILPPDAVHGFLWMALPGLQHFFGASAGPSPPQLPPFT
jgi:hypothetical protein